MEGRGFFLDLRHVRGYFLALQVIIQGTSDASSALVHERRKDNPIHQEEGRDP